VANCHAAKQADLSNAFLRSLRFQTGAQGINLVVIELSWAIKYLNNIG
jgi:hypothetical protein